MVGHNNAGMLPAASPSIRRQSNLDPIRRQQVHAPYMQCTHSIHATHNIHATHQHTQYPCSIQHTCNIQATDMQRTRSIHAPYMQHTCNNTHATHICTINAPYTQHMYAIRAIYMQHTCNIRPHTCTIHACMHATYMHLSIRGRSKVKVGSIGGDRSS